MFTLTWLLVITSFVLLAGMLVAEIVLRHWCGRQDACWRLTCLIVALLPLALAARSVTPKWQWTVGDTVLTGAVLSDSVPDNLLWTGRRPSAESDEMIAPARWPGESTAVAVDTPSGAAALDIGNRRSTSVKLKQKPTSLTRVAAIDDSAEDDGSHESASAMVLTGSDVIASASQPVLTLRLAMLFGLIVWAIGVVYRLARLVWGLQQLNGWRRRSQPLEGARWQAQMDSVSRQYQVSPGSIRLAKSDDVETPLVVGLVSPIILLPASMVPSDDDVAVDDLSLQQVIAHEAVHVYRRDPLWNLLGQWVAALWWPHPLVHVMNRRLCWLRELLCDGHVATHGPSDSYAETLLALATGSKPRSKLATIGIDPPSGTLEKRVRWILSDPSPNQLQPFGRVARVTCALIAATALAIGAMVEPMAEAPAQTPATASSPAAVPATDDANVRGQVRLPDGSKAIGAQVYLLRQPDGAYLLPTKPLITRADFEGAFAFSDVAPGKYQIWAESLDFTSLEKKLRGRRLTVPDQRQEKLKPITIALHEGVGFDVSVTDWEKKPIAGAKVSFAWTDISREYVTNANGLAQIRGLASDGWYFVVRGEGYATTYQRTSEQTLGSVLPMRFALQPGGRMVGTVRDDKGNPVVGAKVTIGNAEEGMTPRYAQVVTDEDGSYAADGLPLKTQLRLYSSQDGYESGRAEYAVPSADQPARGDLVLKKKPYGGDVVVTVFDEKNHPVLGAKLYNHGRSSRDLKEATTDETGSARLSNVEKTHSGYAVIVKADSYIPQRIPFAPGTKDKPTELVVALKPGRTIDGIVVKPDGSPAPNLRVYYNGGEYGGNELGGRVNTDAQGRFQLLGMPEQSTVTVYTPREFAPISRLPVPVDTDKVFRIQMKVAGAIRVRAIDADSGKPIPAFNVKIGFSEIRKPGDPRIAGISSTLTQQGVNIQGTKKSYELSGQTIGAPFKVIVSANGYVSSTIPRVEAQPANLAEIMDVALKPLNAEDYQVVSGRLLHADGSPIAGAAVRLLLGSEIPRPTNGRMSGWRFYHWGLLSGDDIENRDKCVQLLKTVSGSDGKFKFEGVMRDTPWMELFYFRKDLMPQRYSNLRARTDEELTQLELEAEVASTLTVDIDRSKHKNVHSVALSAENYVSGTNAVRLAYSSETIEIGEDNSVTFKHLPSGRYTVSLRAEPIRGERNSFTVQTITSAPVILAPGQSANATF